jgi:integrase
VIRDLIYVLLFTGARKSEVLTMRWRDVDLQAGDWRVPEPKNREPRRVALAGAARSILQRRLANASSSLWVFPGKDPAKHVVDIKRAWERIRDHAGIEDLRVHDLRRTLGSWLLAGGADLVTIQKALGHKDFSSTLVYARIDIDVVRQKVDRAARLLSPRPYLVKGNAT